LLSWRQRLAYWSYILEKIYTSKLPDCSTRGGHAGCSLHDEPVLDGGIMGSNLRWGQGGNDRWGQTPHYYWGGVPAKLTTTTEFPPPVDFVMVLVDYRATAIIDRIRKDVKKK
jgi:hypothetical protein